MRISILFASVVYFMAGRVIWSKREHLNGFLNPLNESPFANTVITEIEITYESRTNLQSNTIPPSSPSLSHPSNSNPTNPYTIAIHASPPPAASQLPAHPLRIRSLSRSLAAAEPNAEAWLYARVAILFFFAMILTWVPASVNRIWQVAHPGAGVNFAMNYAAGMAFSLQGVWNTVVWVVTSKSACWGLWGRGRWGERRDRGRGMELGLGLGKGGQRLNSVSSK
ncbi:G- coupled receptor protein [Rutstroemia sp. NJR-2017a BVV2]|nr:G- coupled receptor protein [Rutstroemia sp. NJR-2017a BVV2]